MSPTEQQTGPTRQPAPTPRSRPSTRCPTTWPWPRSSTPPPATSGASSSPACCARPAARTCPTRSRTRCAVTVATGVSVAPLYTAEDAGDLPTAVGVPGLAAVRARGPRRVRIRRAGRPAAGTSGSGTRTPTSPSRRRRSPPTWRTASPRSGSSLGRGRDPGGRARRRARRRAPRPRAGRACQRRARAAAEAFLSLVEGRTDLAPGGSLGPRPARACTRPAASRRTCPGWPTSPAGPPPTRACAPSSSTRTVFADAGRVGGRGARLLARGRRRLPAGARPRAGLSRRRGVRPAGVPLRASADQFTTIAGLRAARRLWDRVGEVSGASPEARAQRQHAVTSSVMTTQRDPWVNMLRTTVACFAAGVGGADAVTVQPFDAALGLPDAFSRRIARNTQTLLVEEGHLARVLDPAGGSWYVESLTDVAGAGGLGLVHRDRAGRRPGRGAGLRVWSRPDRRHLGRPGAAAGHAHGRDHRRQRVPQPGREAARPRRARRGGRPRARPAGCRGCAPPRSSRRCATAADVGRPRHPGSTWPRSARSPGTPPGPPSRATCSRRAASRRRPVTASPGFADAGTTVACICGTDKDYAEHAAGAGRRSCRRPAPRRCGWPGSRTSASTASTATCSPAATPSTCCAPSTSRLGVQA